MRTCKPSHSKNITYFVSCVIEQPKLLPTTQCHVALPSSPAWFVSNSFFMNVAMSFSILNWSSASLIFWAEQPEKVAASDALRRCDGPKR